MVIKNGEIEGGEGVKWDTPHFAHLDLDLETGVGDFDTFPGEAAPGDADPLSERSPGDLSME